MSFEQDMINASEMLRIAFKSGLTCTDGQFENGERLNQQKGLNNLIARLLKDIKEVRQKNRIKELEEKVHELEQRKPASTIMVIPDKDDKDKNT